MAEKKGRPPIFKTEKALEKAVNAYFNAISTKRPVPNTFNSDGKQYYETIFLEAPTVSGLCLFLRISRKTWENYCADDKFAFVTERTKMRMEAYCENILLTREKGSLQGVIFNLQHNYGWRDKKTVELGAETVDALGNLSLAEKMSMVAALKSGELDIPEPIEDDEDDEQ